MKLQDVGRYFRDRRVSLARKGLALFAVAYAVMPIDAIPDFIPVFGWLDDVGVVTAITTFFWWDVKRHAAALGSPASTELSGPRDLVK